MAIRHLLWGTAPNNNDSTETWLRRKVDSDEEEKAWFRRKIDERDKENALLANELRASKELNNELRTCNTDILRERGILFPRGALEYLLDRYKCHPPNRQPVLSGLMSPSSAEEGASIFAMFLSQCNESSKIKCDNGNKAHTPDSMAKLLCETILGRLHKDAHDRRSPNEFKAMDDTIVLKQNGISHSDCLVLYNLFSQFKYPVKMWAATDASEG